MFDKILLESGLSETENTKILTDSLLDKIRKYVDDMELDYDEYIKLPSTYYDRNPYGVEDELVGSSGGYFNDNDDEVFEAKLNHFIEYIEDDGILNYIEIDDNDLKGDYKVDDLDDMGSDAEELLIKEIKEAFDI